MSAAAQAPTRLSALENLRKTWAREGVESLTAALKIVSDLSAQEIALVVGMVRERVSLRPIASITETAGQFVSGFTDAGKVLLDLAAGETVLVADGVKDALHLRPKTAALVDIIPQSVGTLVNMHKRFLNAFANQTKEVVDSYTSGRPVMAGARVAKVTQEGIEAFIDAQKKFLDHVAEQVTTATEPGKEGRPYRGERVRVLTRLARESVDKFTQAQKQVMDLAIDQIEASNGRNKNKPAPQTSLGDLTRKSVQNFATAQKSLLDLALKTPPVKAVQTESAKAEKAHKRAGPSRKAARKRAATSRKSA